MSNHCNDRVEEFHALHEGKESDAVQDASYNKQRPALFWHVEDVHVLALEVA